MDPQLTSLVATLGLGVLGWWASLWWRDASLADRYWPWLVTCGVWLPLAAGNWLVADRSAPASGGSVLAIGPAGLLGLLWAARLGIHLSIRNWGRGEDRRYTRLRERHGRAFGWRSLWLVFLLQAALAWLVGAPLRVTPIGTGTKGLAILPGTAPAGAGTAWAVLLAHDGGLLLAAAGIVIEAVADLQLARFLAEPGNRGRVMEGGLWRYSRHPNYFGEACVWWGFGMASASVAPWTLVSPLLMTVLLLRVSGVTLLERDIGERRPGYAAYVARTPAFWPAPPRSTESR